MTGRDDHARVQTNPIEYRFEAGPVPVEDEATRGCEALHIAATCTGSDVPESKRHDESYEADHECTEEKFHGVAC